MNGQPINPQPIVSFRELVERLRPEIEARLNDGSQIWTLARDANKDSFVSFTNSPHEALRVRFPVELTLPDRYGPYNAGVRHSGGTPHQMPAAEVRILPVGTSCKLPWPLGGRSHDSQVAYAREQTDRVRGAASALLQKLSRICYADRTECLDPAIGASAPVLSATAPVANYGEGHGPSDAKDWEGLGGIIDNAYPLYGIDPEEDPRWKSHVMTAPRPLTTCVFADLVRKVSSRSGPREANLCAVMSPRSRDACATLGILASTSTQPGLVVQAGLRWIPVMVDPYCQERTVYIVNRDDLMRFTHPGAESPMGFSYALCDYSYADGQAFASSTLHLTVTMALGTRRRDRHARIDNFG